MTYLSRLGYWLLPQSCFLCGDISHQPLCHACLADLPYQQTACNRCAYVLCSISETCENCRREPVVFEDAKTVFAYEYPVDKLIHAAKFHQNLAILDLLGQLMAQYITVETLPDVLIPVPLHPSGLRSRGYNQALELAKVIARYHHIPLDYTACQCIKKKRKQSTLSGRSERRKNVQGIFQVKQVKSHWQHVVLVDDVVTTGETANELAKVFLQAGIQRVSVWCCARRN
ncbi:double zinc ribbon domain-containing protein [Thiotrichales bacterium HSG14]|nr:double zinc ribbon domain-containing protein [Thiotrichales bacterium HSG14]